ncbi:MAG: hypothetical protein ABIC40_07570 [bacterium]
MLIRGFIFIVVGLLAILIGDVADVRLGWSLDLAWILIAASAFAYPPEIAPIAGIIFGLTLDSMSGNGSLIYTVSYGGFAAILIGARRVFFMKSFLTYWIASIVGGEALWLFMGMYVRAINLMGGTARVPGWVSPYLPEIVVGFPIAYFLVGLILREPKGSGKEGRLYAARKVIRG